MFPCVSDDPLVVDHTQGDPAHPFYRFWNAPVYCMLIVRQWAGGSRFVCCFASARMRRREGCLAPSCCVSELFWHALPTASAVFKMTCPNRTQHDACLPHFFVALHEWNVVFSFDLSHYLSGYVVQLIGQQLSMFNYLMFICCTCHHLIFSIIKIFPTTLVFLDAVFF